MRPYVALHANCGAGIRLLVVWDSRLCGQIVGPFRIVFMSLDSQSLNLELIDLVLEERLKSQRKKDDEGSRLQAVQQRFHDDFCHTCETEIIPTLEAIATRLLGIGGGSQIVYQPHSDRACLGPTLVFWMSFEGDITRTPSEERFPYLKLEANARVMKVEVSEGDCWQPGDTWRSVGAHRRGLIGVWDLKDITAAAVIEETSMILARASTDIEVPRSTANHPLGPV